MLERNHALVRSTGELLQGYQITWIDKDNVPYTANQTVDAQRFHFPNVCAEKRSTSIGSTGMGIPIYVNLLNNVVVIPEPSVVDTVPRVDVTTVHRGNHQANGGFGAASATFPCTCLSLNQTEVRIIENPKEEEEGEQEMENEEGEQEMEEEEEIKAPKPRRPAKTSAEHVREFRQRKILKAQEEAERGGTVAAGNPAATVDLEPMPGPITGLVRFYPRPDPVQIPSGSGRGTVQADSETFLESILGVITRSAGSGVGRFVGDLREASESRRNRPALGFVVGAWCLVLAGAWGWVQAGSWILFLPAAGNVVQRKRL
ncbi:conserved hypothetical protein [Culex quinquefasciatus]|uniref:Uncharacterized protein n=1 Tax=Culex quinquefasciatus TaxID=7176 RepID=B0XJW8_CULQU|nr:conserved hypothetical protein [Culex quinquefasciatus]|eukprot:XP_001869940.1 conserved hypothetical protein [Culex quinquefasciatus]